MRDELGLLDLWRFRPGATVRDSAGDDWVKRRNGHWQDVVSHTMRGSFSLLRKNGPLRRML